MTPARPLVAMAMAALALTACGTSKGTSTTGDTVAPKATGTISLTSTAFNADGRLPVQFTCDGEGKSPPLAWSGVPKNAGHLTLTVSDPDAHGYVHWKVVDIPPRDGYVAEGGLPPGGTVVQPWRPACPPKGAGVHHYAFKLEAKPSGSGGLTATYQR